MSGEYPFVVKLFDKKVAVGVTNTTKSLYSIKKNIQRARFFGVTLEHSKFMEPVDTAIFRMNPEGDLI